MKKLYSILAFAFTAFFLFNINAWGQNQLPGSWKVFDKYNSFMDPDYSSFGPNKNYDVDNMGNLWIFKSGTGLIKYDGVDTTMFTNGWGQLISITPNSSLYNYKTNCFWMMYLESVYIHGTVLVKYDLSTGLTTTFSGVEEHNYFSSMVMDSLGKMWFTCPGGLVKYDNENWTIYNQSNSNISIQWANCVAVDRDNNIWCASDNIVVKYNGNDWEIIGSSISYFPSSPICNIAIDSNNMVWVSSYSQESGLSMYNGFFWTKFNSLPATVSESVNSRYGVSSISGLSFDNKNNLWVTTNNGFVRYNGSNWSLYNRFNCGLSFVCANPVYLFYYDNSFFTNSIRCTSDGRMFMSYCNYLVEYIPDGLSNPDSPSNLTASVETNSINLSWSASQTPGVYYFIYKISQQNAMPVSYTDIIGGFYSETNSFIDSVVDLNKTYRYAVFAEKNKQRSLPLFIEANTVSEPTNLSVLAQGSNNILSWSASATVGVTYDVYKRYREADYQIEKYDNWQSTPIASNVAILNYIDTSVGEYDNCYYKILANKNGLMSDPEKSNEAFARRKIRPLILQSVQAQSGGNNVTWQSDNDWSQPYPTYVVYRKEVGGEYQEIVDSLQWIHSYLDNDADLNRSYYYTVTKKKDGDESAKSNEIFIKGYLAPDSISAELISGQSKGYRLIWPANSVSQLLYNIYRREAGDTSNVMIHQLSANSTGYEDILTGSQLDKEYYYFVKSQLDTDEGSRSNEIFTADLKDSLKIEVVYFDIDSNQVSCDSLMRNQTIRCRITIKDKDSQPLEGVNLNINNNACENGTCQSISTDRAGQFDYNFKTLEFYDDETQYSEITQIKEKSIVLTASSWTKKTMDKIFGIKVKPDMIWDSGFRPSKDGFSFNNDNQNNQLWSVDRSEQPYDSIDFREKYFNQCTLDTIPTNLYPDWNLWARTFGYDQCYENGLPKTSAVQKWKEYSSNVFPGECYGFCVSALLRYDGISQVSQAGTCYSISINNAKEWINIYQQYQFGQKQKAYEKTINDLYHLGSNYYSLRKMVDTLIKGMKGSRDNYRLLGVFVNPTNEAFPISHVVFPYRIERSFYEDVLYIYDPNAVSGTNNHSKKLIIAVNESGIETFSYNGVEYTMNVRLMPLMDIIEYAQIPQIYSTLNREAEFSFDYRDNSDELLFLYPNPTSDFINVHFSNLDNDYAKIEIFNMLGDLVLLKQVDIKKNSECDQSINCLNLSPGVYLCKLSLGDKKYHSSFIVH